MPGGVINITLRGVPGGQEVIARKKSSRGTRYISDSIVVLREEKTPEQFARAVQAAAVKLYGEDPKIG